ncbi:MAG TPA: M4 family metallopeptidase [candidate division Zixibacteria bacterium]|jgi:Zn-dependent metalloprotease
MPTKAASQTVLPASALWSLPLPQPSQVKGVVGSPDPRTGWHVRWNESNGTPSYVTGAGLSQPAPNQQRATSIEDRTIQFLAANREIFKIDDPEEELIVKETIPDKLGMYHVVLEQQYLGVPYWANNLVAHYNQKGDLYCLNARYSPTPKQIGTVTPSMAAEAAVGIAMRDLASLVEIEAFSPPITLLLNYENPIATLYIWSLYESDDPRLVWHVEIRPNISQWWYYFVDAQTGEVLEKYNNAQADGPVTGSGIDLFGVNRTLNLYQGPSQYYMIDASRPMWPSMQLDPIGNPQGALVTVNLSGVDLGHGPLFHVTSVNNTWSDPTTVSAHYNMGLTFEYFLNDHGRLAIDGNGSRVTSVVHATQNSQPMDNAFWNGVFMVYGDGGVTFGPLAKALDVAAHEMAHGVNEHTVKLEYKFESGALNESFSDVYGALVDDADWLIGEDITVGNPSGALRNMADPHNGGASFGDPGWQPANMGEYVSLPLEIDNGGVHVNSGIPNKAAYLIGNAIGREKLGQIYYRIQSQRYLNQQSNFCDMRAAAIQSSTDLFGNPSSEVDAVEAAFDAVGILTDCGGLPPPPPPAYPMGQDWIAFIATDWSLWKARPVISGPEDIVPITATKLNALSGKPLDVGYAADAVLMYVTEAFNLRLVAPDGSGETEIPSDVDWWSLAVSPDFTKVALTAREADSLIWIIDLLDEENSGVVHLYSPTTQSGLNAYTTLYADVMDWDPSGSVLLYDALNSVQLSGGVNQEYWELNALDASTGTIIRLFPPQPFGVNIGNPEFAQSSSVVFAFDYFDELFCTNDIMAVNIYTGQMETVLLNGCDPWGDPNLGFPRFAPDGRALAFQWIDPSGMPIIWQAPLDESLLQVSGPLDIYLNSAQRPLWFGANLALGVEDDQSSPAIPRQFSLRQNYPNPFNAATVVPFDVAVWARVQLTVHDILGRHVATLVDEQKNPGTYQLEWTALSEHGEMLPSGVYFLTINVEGQRQTRQMVLLK